MILGYLRVLDYLTRVSGLVTGALITDAKDRQYRREYGFQSDGDRVVVQRADGFGDPVSIPASIPLDEALVAFFGLYSGDGAKGTEDPSDSRRIVPAISFSQRERNLVRFAVDQFRRLFPGNIRFVFSLGEDSAYFMSGEGDARLAAFYGETKGSSVPARLPLAATRPTLDSRDQRYLEEVRPDVPGRNEDHLAFYYQYKSDMRAILSAEKISELATVGIVPSDDIRVSASLRRPFKKGARLPGGSSRSDEIYVGGINGIGELFLKMMHEIEDSVLHDERVSSSGLVEWIARPSGTGEDLDLAEFFNTSPFGVINGLRPRQLAAREGSLVGQWPRSKETRLKQRLRIDPLWCYIAGLYLAEGSTPKSLLFSMFRDSPGSMTLGFTSSEGTSLELMLRALQRLFPVQDCITAWKVKVGSQYFPELVVIGQKHGVPMLRGGAKGEGKLRTMEISLPIKDWALHVADAPLRGEPSLLRGCYSDLYSHVEPTGAGVARIDFWGSSTLTRWYFPLLMYSVFSATVPDPATGLTV